MEIVCGVVGIEYSHFFIGEPIEGALVGVDQMPDFRTEQPVIITPGKVTVRSCVQSHDAWVTLMLADCAPVEQSEQWPLLGVWSYEPAASGRMILHGPTTGPARPAVGWLPGGHDHPRPLKLSPGTKYAVHVYARGRKDSRARFEAAMTRKDFGLHEGFEDYVVVFVPVRQRAGMGTPDVSEIPVTSPQRNRLADTRPGLQNGGLADQRSAVRTRGGAGIVGRRMVRRGGPGRGTVRLPPAGGLRDNP
ncbi:hypothetical protein [Streptomyces sp. TN58]|uniref:hypothetical protein n=1 Tax=Streptomyces sp. TN58 TaxID=234612 RepID=UPI0009503C3C|nr:hypothetical protein [Streptomyces sp. TN58]APU38867.1 hypothetical protein BSL84_02900 [Streptomyces sp. TN58]